MIAGGAPGHLRRSSACRPATSSGRSSYQPLHVPGRDERTVATYALLHDQHYNTMLLAQMHHRADIAQMVLTVGCTTDATGVSLILGPQAVREFLDVLDQWALDTLAAISPVRAAALATGATSGRTQDDRSGPPKSSPTMTGPGYRIKARSNPEWGQLLAIAVVRCRAEEDNAFTVLDLNQVRELRDGLRLWLRWARFPTDSGLIDLDQRPGSPRPDLNLARYDSHSHTGEDSHEWLRPDPARLRRPAMLLGEARLR